MSSQLSHHIEIFKWYPHLSQTTGYTKGNKNRWWQHKCSSLQPADLNRSLTQQICLLTDMRLSTRLSTIEKTARQNVRLTYKIMKNSMKEGIPLKTSNASWLDSNSIQAIITSILALATLLTASLQHRWMIRLKLYKPISKTKSRKLRWVEHGHPLQVDWLSIYNPLALTPKAKQVVKLILFQE